MLCSGTIWSWWTGQTPDPEEPVQSWSFSSHQRVCVLLQPRDRCHHRTGQLDRQVLPGRGRLCPGGQLRVHADADGELAERLSSPEVKQTLHLLQELLTVGNVPVCPGKVLFSQGERAALQSQHFHPQQPLGRLGLGAGVHGGGECSRAPLSFRRPEGGC